MGEGGGGLQRDCSLTLYTRGEGEGGQRNYSFALCTIGGGGWGGLYVVLLYKIKAKILLLYSIIIRWGVGVGGKETVYNIHPLSDREQRD